MKPDPRILDELLGQIIQIAEPLQIILFGSAARGDMRVDSDLDILIVVAEGTHRRRMTKELYSRISGISAPFDLVVVTPSILEKNRDNIGLIYHRILREGKEIYAA